MPKRSTPFENELNREPVPAPPPPQLHFWGCRPWTAEGTGGGAGQRGSAAHTQVTPRLPGASGHRTKFSRSELACDRQPGSRSGILQLGCRP